VGIDKYRDKCRYIAKVTQPWRYVIWMSKPLLP
jgi:hypothetical protein